MRLKTQLIVSDCVEGVECNVYFSTPPTADGWYFSDEVASDEEATRFLTITGYFLADDDPPKKPKRKSK